MKTLKIAILISFLFVSFNSFANLNDGLVGYWSFDDCTAKDNSGNGYDGRVQGNPQCIDRIKGKAFSLNGDSVNISENLKTDYFSFSGLFKTSSTGGDNDGNMIIRLRYWGYSITVDNGKLGAGVTKSNDSGYSFSSEKSVADDKYHHVALSYGATTGYNLYLDGVLISSQNTGNNPPIYFISDGGYSFGKDGNYYGHFFKGVIDEFRIYNRALTTSEITALYEQEREEIEREVVLKAKLEREEAARYAKEESERQVKYQKFRKHIKEGDDTTNGVVIEVKGSLVKIQTNDSQCTQRDYEGDCRNYVNTPIEKWFKKNEVYPHD